MKKTLITLMALASCAMGVTLEDFTEYAVASTVNAADFSTHSATIALTLDVNVLKGYFQQENLGSHLILDIIGNNDIGFGTLVKKKDEVTSEYFSGAWNQNVDYAMTGSYLDMAGNSTTIEGSEEVINIWANASEASLVFSADRTTGARVVFTLVYENGSTWQTVGTAGGVKAGAWDPTGELTVDTSVVKTLAVYDGYIAADDAKAIGTALVVPEPATATLSLLALAGLAARRRRK